MDGTWYIYFCPCSCPVSNVLDVTLASLSLSCHWNDSWYMGLSCFRARGLKRSGGSVNCCFNTPSDITTLFLYVIKAAAVARESDCHFISLLYHYEVTCTLSRSCLFSATQIICGVVWPNVRNISAPFREPDWRGFAASHFSCIKRDRN